MIDFKRSEESVQIVRYDLPANEVLRAIQEYLGEYANAILTEETMTTINSDGSATVKTEFPNNDDCPPPAQSIHRATINGVIL